MARIVKKSRHLRFEGIVTIFFLVSLILYFCSITMLRSYNVVLASKENKMEYQIETLKNDVANLELDVKKLDNRERILSIAQEKGLQINQEKIVSVKSDE